MDCNSKTGIDLFTTLETKVPVGSCPLLLQATTAGVDLVEAGQARRSDTDIVSSVTSH